MPKTSKTEFKNKKRLLNKARKLFKQSRAFEKAALEMTQAFPDRLSEEFALAAHTYRSAQTSHGLVAHLYVNLGDDYLQDIPK